MSPQPSLLSGQQAASPPYKELEEYILHFGVEMEIELNSQSISLRNAHKKVHYSEWYTPNSSCINRYYFPSIETRTKTLPLLHFSAETEVDCLESTALNHAVQAAIADGRLESWGVLLQWISQIHVRQMLSEWHTLLLPCSSQCIHMTSCSSVSVTEHPCGLHCKLNEQYTCPPAKATFGNKLPRTSCEITTRSKGEMQITHKYSTKKGVALVKELLTRHWIECLQLWRIEEEGKERERKGTLGGSNQSQWWPRKGRQFWKYWKEITSEHQEADKDAVGPVGPSHIRQPERGIDWRELSTEDKPQLTADRSPSDVSDSIFLPTVQGMWSLCTHG